MNIYQLSRIIRCLTNKMVADHIILVVALSSWTFCDNAGTVHVVVIDNSEVNLEINGI